jgi:guanylate kinase
MHFILLLGPPGSGKSTIIRSLKQDGIEAYDLEEYGHGATGFEKRKAKAEELVRTCPKEGVALIGMADVDPDVFPPESTRVMILPSFDVYKDRLEKRDAEQIDKQGQGGIEYKYASFQEQAKSFSHVIVNDGSVEEAISHIQQLIHNQK